MRVRAAGTASPLRPWPGADLSATLVADGVTVVRGPALVLSEVALTVAPGTRLGVVGPNGTGKSTLLQALSGALLPDSGSVHLAPPTAGVGGMWVQFVQVILALSGVEAIASMTGVMKTNPGSDPEKPQVSKTASKALLVVAVEVVIATVVLGWAMLSIPTSFAPELTAHKEDMLRYLADYYGALAVSPAVGTALGIVVGVVFGLLLFSAVNTAVVALIGVIYMMAQDGELPKQLVRLNKNGVPLIPLIVAIAIPILSLIHI